MVVLLFIEMGLISQLEEWMKKRILIGLLSIFVFVTVVSALTMDDLDISDKMTVEEYLIENVDEITQGNVDDLEGEEYRVLAVTDDYIIVEIDGEIFVILQ